MQTFIHKSILILLCLYSGIHFPGSTISLTFSTGDPETSLPVLLLISLIFSFLSDLTTRKIRIVLYLLFFCFCLKNPATLCFLPLLLYNIHQDFHFSSFIILFLFPWLYPDPFSIVLSLIAIYFFYSKKQLLLLRHSNRTLQNDLHEKVLSFVRVENQKEKDIEIAILSERNRIARQIHDAIGHTLSSGILQAEALKLSAPEELTEDFDTLQQTLKSGMFDIRRSLHHLHSSSLHLQEELTKIAKQSQPLSVELNCHLNEETMDYALKFELISIVKEAVTNVNKHSDATKLSVRFTENPGFYALSIKDNGLIPPATDQPNQPGIGLISLQEFAKKHSGNLSFGFDRGFYIHLTLKK